MQSANANLWLHAASDDYGPVPFQQAVAAVEIAEDDAEQRAVAAAAAMFCPYRIGIRCDAGRPCDYKCEFMAKFRDDMRRLQIDGNRIKTYLDDKYPKAVELAQKVATVNERIEKFRKDVFIKFTQPETAKNNGVSPGSWSERETTLKTSQNEKAE